MKRNKAVGLFLMIIIIFQALYFLNDESLHLYSFAVGINRESKDAMDIITMAVFLVPVFFIDRLMSLYKGLEKKGMRLCII